MSELRILNNGNLNHLLGEELAAKLNIKSGDTTVQLETEEQIEVGRAVFEALISQGWAGYAVSETGQTEKKLDKFDPSTFRTVMFSPVVGG